MTSRAIKRVEGTAWEGTVTRLEDDARVPWVEGTVVGPIVQSHVGFPVSRVEGAPWGPTMQRVGVGAAWGPTLGSMSTPLA